MTCRDVLLVEMDLKDSKVLAELDFKVSKAFKEQLVLLLLVSQQNSGSIPTLIELARQMLPVQHFSTACME
jgi:hypothetical protein